MATRKYIDYLQDSIHEEIRRLKQINHHLYTSEYSLSGYTREGILVTGLNLVNRNLQKAQSNLQIDKHNYKCILHWQTLYN